MIDWIAALVGWIGLIGFGWWARGRHEAKAHNDEMPYRYLCEEHAVFIESNIQEVPLTFAEAHEEAFHRG